jgi:hypothetical protein
MSRNVMPRAARSTAAAAVPQGIPRFHAGEHVLDAGAYPPVRGASLVPPGGRLGLAGLAPVRDEQPGAPVAAVGDHGRLPGGPVTPEAAYASEQETIPFRSPFPLLGERQNRATAAHSGRSGWP